MQNSSIFKDIINKKIPASIVYQDEQVTAFKDIHPKAPVHILTVSYTHLTLPTTR
jgi:histidine triad (HIT) family protein